MNKTTNRRRAPRLRYRVTVRFAEDSADNKPTSEGQMLDVSSGGLAFRCSADENCPHEGQQLVTQFSIPSPEVRDPSMSFDPAQDGMKFSRTGRVLRVQQVNEVLRNVAVRFDEPLPVGKVFFDTIGLYMPSPPGQNPSTDIDGMDEDEFLGLAMEQRIKELEQELAELKCMRMRKPRRS
ncbi:MAG: hypothetical protein A2Z25_12885 [Planctomycetes bacterium RBG_16_55_9]|nr:MAG: hypothetical protein A2Z25_12885 [Planctomycetes bacterium RBG_16_55_9]